MAKGKPSILYVDDETSNLDVFESSFWKEFDVHVADSAKKGREILDKTEVQLIITDQRMPEMTGVQFLESILEIHPEPVRMILTGYSDMEAIVDSINKGRIYHYVTKPWKKAELKTTIDNALEVYQLKRQNKHLLEDLKVANKKLEQKVEEGQQVVSAQEEELKHTSSKLEVTKNIVEKSEKMASLGMLSAGIGHEINNPVNFVSSGINSLKRNFSYLLDRLEKDNSGECGPLGEFLKSEECEELTKETRELLEDLSMGIDRTKEIIKGLKSYAYSDPKDFQKADVHELIENVITLVSPKAKYDIEFVRYYVDSIPKLNCNPGQISQVLMNIMVNAIQSIEGKGVVEISTSIDKDQLNIGIKDNGVGMTEEVKNRLFEPFFTTKELGEGTGLGMSISSDIVKAHLGTIEVTSEIDKGTEFFVLLPINGNGNAYVDKEQNE
ncbi:MAG: ATP-binding protein [Bacteroidota bacterium]